MMFRQQPTTSRDRCGTHRDPEGRYADDRGHEKVGVIAGAQSTTGYTGVHRQASGRCSEQVSQDDADRFCPFAEGSAEAGSPAERQRAGQGKGTGFGVATAEPFAGRTGTTEAICAAYRRKAR